MLVLLLYLEIVSSASWGFPFQKIWRKVSGSANLNLILYEIVAILWLIGFPLFIQESQHPFLLEAFPTIWNQILTGLISVVGMLFLNVARYERFGLAERHAQSTYAWAEELIEENESPEEGLEEAIRYIENCKKYHRGVSEVAFLSRLSTRGDDISLIAAKKLENLQSRHME
jgi:hypothetical protein